MALFEKPSHASLYAKFRPTYSKDLFDILLGYMERCGTSHDQALDVACGSGQSTFLLLDHLHFTQCIGVDISRAQISEAQKITKTLSKNNVTFMVGNAEELPVEASSMDLVTIATAWHWLTEPHLFYSECKRVLKPNGCLAVYGYGLWRLLHEEANVLLTGVINTFKKYWAESMRHFHNNYAELILPFANVERHDFVMVQQFSLSRLNGFLSSMTAYQKYCDVYPGNTLLSELDAGLTTVLAETAANAAEIIVDIEFPIYVVLGRNNQKVY